MLPFMAVLLEDARLNPMIYENEILTIEWLVSLLVDLS